MKYEALNELILFAMYFVLVIRLDQSTMRKVITSSVKLTTITGYWQIITSIRLQYSTSMW